MVTWDGREGETDAPGLLLLLLLDQDCFAFFDRIVKRKLRKTPNEANNREKRACERVERERAPSVFSISSFENERATEENTIKISLPIKH